MKRTLVILFALGMLAICATAGWLVLQSPELQQGPAGGATDGPADDPAETTPSETDSTRPTRTRKPRKEVEGVDDPDRRALAGVVRFSSGEAVAGVGVTVHAATEGSGMAARMKALEKRFGQRFGRGADDEDSSGEPGEVTEELIQEGMEAGIEMLTDGSLAEVLGDIGSMASREYEDAIGERLGGALTDEEGRFRVEDLEEGAEVQIRIEHPGHVRIRQGASVGDLDVSVHLRPGATVDGVVVAGELVVEGATVRIKGGGSAVSGSDGRFHIEGVRAPGGGFLVSAPGHVTGGFNIPVTLEGPNDDIRLELTPAGKVTGRVSGPAGPIAGATVTIGSAGFNPMAMMGMAQQGQAATFAGPAPVAVSDESGRYELDGVPVGKHPIQAEAPGHLRATVKDVDVQAGEVTPRIDFALERAAMLAGTVTGAGGEPLAGAKVKIVVPSEAEGMAAMIEGMFGGSAKTVTTDLAGHYRAERLPPGERKITVTANGWLDGEGSVTLTADEEARYDVELEQGITISGIVRAPTGEPIVDATVSVEWKGAGPANPMVAMIPGMGSRNTRKFTTDGNGAFEATGLQRGPYSVTATAQGFLEASVKDVAEGATDVDLTVGSAASIRGIVSAEVDSLPVAEAKVFYRGGKPKGGGNPFLAMMQGDQSITTADDGSFELAGLEPGRYTLYARRRGFADSEQLSVELAEGQSVEDVLLALPPAVTLSGRVVTKGTNTPVAGAVVYVPAGTNPIQNVATSDFTGGEFTAPTGSFSAIADDNGSFVITGLTPGDHTVHARATGYAAAVVAGAEAPGPEVVIELGVGGTVRGRVLTADGTPRPGKTVMLQQGVTGQRMATSNDKGEYELTNVPPGSYMLMLIDMGESFMPQGVSVALTEGEVTTHDFQPNAQGTQTVTGHVLKGDKPLTGATVMLTGGAGGMRMETSDAQGNFTFRNVEPGSYTVMVQASMMGGGSTSAKVEVEKGRDPRKVRIRISVLEIRGVVVDVQSGDPIPLAQVVLIDGGTDVRNLEELVQRQKGQAITSTDGSFVIAGVPEGSFTMRVTAQGYPQRYIEGVRAGSGDVTVKLEGGTELVVRVLDPDGKPVAGAAVTAEDGGGRMTTTFDMNLSGTTLEDGRATLILAPGVYTIHAQADGFPGASAPATAGSGELTIRLSPGGTIDVRVKDGDGNPVSGASVAFLDGDGNPLRSRLTMATMLSGGAATDAAGRLLRRGLPPGEVTVVVSLTDRTPVRRTLSVGAGKTVKVDVELP